MDNKHHEFKCQECGKLLTTKQATKGVCPKCGSSDIDVNLEVFETKKKN